MPGPAPKHPQLRQRRNISTTRAVLPAEEQPRTEPPELPPHLGDGGWSAMAVQWWRDVWSSPMQVEFLRGDEPALCRLVALVDQFWKDGDLATAREIRLLEREFGLTPLSRRRLEWSVVRVEDAIERLEDDRGQRDRKRSKRARVIADPRTMLDS
jgi:hypothetical protein